MTIIRRRYRQLRERFHIGVFVRFIQKVLQGSHEQLDNRNVAILNRFQKSFPRPFNTHRPQRHTSLLRRH